jgi:pyruvate/2-oxoglutarate dehydrogenase complex dihydrolipoamide acyltransferase (E2) component
MTSASISTIHVVPGTLVTAGAPVVDVMVDLSALAPQDCAPISHFRLALREAVWLRRLEVAAGDEVAVEGCIALLSTTEDEAGTGEAARPARITAIEILPDWQVGLW